MSEPLRITVKQLRESTPALNRLAQQPFPAVASFRIARVLRVVEPELETCEQTRRSLFERYGETDEDKTVLQIADKNSVAFATEWDAVLACELDLEIRPLPLSLLADAEITPSDLLVLDWLIAEDDNA